jgi:glycerol-3-phosphate dehydrogenase (NAD(P)+)
MTKQNLNIAVLGDGGWGTALAVLLSKKKYKVTLWSVFKDYACFLDKKRLNKKYLPGIKIPSDIVITHDLADALRNKDLVVLAVPSGHLRKVLGRINKLDYPRQALYVSVVKGIELGTLKRMSQVIHEILGGVKLAVLSGPTIAQEVARGIPTAAVITSSDAHARKYLQSVFMTERFRVYSNYDIIGVELGGSLKNIIAIACGISDGLGFGTNAKAAILTRGLAEISRLGAVMGANPATFSGISGLGDLVTTCISQYSRNRYVGEQIGRGKRLKEVISHMQMVAEGVPTAKSAYALSLKYNVDMPITQEIYRVLYKNKPALKAVRDLMCREGKEEIASGER